MPQDLLSLFKKKLTYPDKQVYNFSNVVSIWKYCTSKTLRYAEHQEACGGRNVPGFWSDVVQNCMEAKAGHTVL